MLGGQNLTQKLRNLIQQTWTEERRYHKSGTNH